jgi:hypothetical protein
MNGPPKIPAGKGNGRARFLVAIAVLAGVAFLTVTLSFSAWRTQLGRSVDAKVAAIKAAGLPVDWQDLSRWPTSVPDNENAAFIYTNAIAHLNDTNAITRLERPMGTDSGIYEVLYFRQPVSAKMRAEFESAVRTNTVALNIISQVANASESRYPIDYLDGPAAQLPHLGGLRSLSEILACDAILKVEASNAPAASDDVLSQLNLSRSLDNEPVLISQVASGNMLNTSCHTLQQVLSRAPLSGERLSQLESQFIAVEATNRFLTAMIGERALNGEIIRLAQDDPQKFSEIGNETSPGDDQSELPRNPGAGWKFIGFFERDRNYYLDGMATDLFFIQQGPPASLGVSDVDERIRDEAKKQLCILSAMFLPSAAGIAKRDAATRAELRDTIAAIAVERWRLMHNGSLPDSLSDLVPAFLPAVPEDPYDAQPLRYKKLKKGYCIYSIGPNLRDDGGKPRPRPSARVPFEERNNYDIVFTVER